MTDHVFVYGSLAHGAAGVACELHGWRRLWGVAMDNAVAIAGYKRYRDADGGFPDVCVAFLDIVEHPGGAVAGLCVPAPDLDALDRRERNYERVDVTGAVAGGPRGRIWAFAGRHDSRARLREARAAGRAVVVRSYERAVARFGVPHDMPVLDLHRVQLPATC